MSLISAVILGLFACQGRKSEAASVSFMIFGDPAERQAYLTLVDAFQRTHPGIQVEVTHIPSPQDYRTRLATEFIAGTPPDVSLMNYRRFASFAARGLLEAVGPFLEASEVIGVSDFYPIAIDAFTWESALVCLPQNISSLVVYYNQDLFDAAGVPYPHDSWTWEEFVDTARDLTIDADGDGRTDQYGLGVEPSLFRLAPFVWQNGGPIVDDDLNPTRLTLTRFPSLQALEWFVDLRQVHGVVPGRQEEASLDSESRFMSGVTAMFLNSRRGTPTYRQIDAFTWDVAPLPIGKTAAGILHSDAYCISRATVDKGAAWTFVEFANSFEGQSIIAETGRTVPSLMAVAEAPAFLDPTRAPSRSRVWLDTVSDLRRVPLISTWEEIERVADEEIERAFYGDITPEMAAQLAVQRTDEYFTLALTQQP